MRCTAAICVRPRRVRVFCATCCCVFPSIAAIWRRSNHRRVKKRFRSRTFCASRAGVSNGARRHGSIKFTATASAECGPAHKDWIGAIALSGEGGPVIATASASEVRLASGARFPFPGGPANRPPSLDGILQIDFSYDFKTDLVLAGAGGVRLFRQESPSSFTDVTAETKLPATVVNAKYTGAWSCGHRS